MSDNQLSKFKRENKTLKEKNAELEETLRAIRNGEVDALVVSSPLGERIFTLQSAEQPYRELVEAMNEGAITITPEGIILYCNARFASMTKCPREKIIGSNFDTHVLPENHNILRNLLRDGKFKPLSDEILLKVVDGYPLPTQLSLAPIELIGTEGFCIIATDLSAQKRNAVNLQQQEWLTKLLNSLPIPLVLLDPSLESISFVNLKAQEMISPETSPESDAKAKEMFRFESEAGEMLEIEDVVDRSQVGETSSGTEIILVTELGKVPVLAFCETLPAMHGKDPAKLLMFQDISSMKFAQNELTYAIKGRDQFMAALSHELRTPLNVILGWVQLLRASPNDKEMFDQALDTLERNAELQRALIEDLLDMSRIITGNLILEKRPLDLKKSVSDCLISLQLKAEDKGVRLVQDMLVEPAIISADDKRIQQLIFNLVQNSIKFTQAGGQITVRVRTSIFKKAATIEVIDTGLGIESNFLPNVFDQFKQENMSTNRAYGGLGLGLAICKTIVEQHRGEITAFSEGRGKGTTITVELPLSSVPTKSVSSEAKSPNLLDLKGLRVLVVDDSPDNLTLFSIWLRKAGAEIKTLTAATDIVDELREFKPDVLLSDISMPGEDGFTLIAKVRALSANEGGSIPAGAITANARSEDRDQTLAAGYQLHIAKPVTNNRLIEAVKSLSEMRGI